MRTFNNSDGLLYDYDSASLVPIMEFWTPITDLSTPGVLPIYMISNLGRVYDIENHQFLQLYTDKARGYVHVYLKAKDNSIRIGKVHRLVMIEFHGFSENEKQNQVDHISGIKLDNSEYNLRWVSNQENINYAYENGLMPSGEDSPISKLTNDQVRHICEMMQNEIPIYDIVNYISSCGIISAMTVFRSINQRIAWKHISKDYSFKVYDNIRNPSFSEEEIHIICQCLEKNMNHGDIIRYLGYDTNSMTKNEVFRMYTSISKIKKGENYTDISNQYNIDRDASKNRFTDEEVHIICKMLCENKSSKEILSSLGYDVDKSVDKAMYFKYMNGLSRIRSRTGYTHISRYYNF